MGDEPFVVTVKRALLDQIWTDPLRWQDLAIFDFKPEQVHRLTIKTDKELELVRDAKNQWTWAKGGGAVNQTNLQTLLHALSTLHAVEWVGGTLPGHGFDKPQAVITFTTSPDDKSAHKLTIGGTAPNGNWFAKVDERDGTFVISAADLNALKSPLAAQQSPTPAPPASAMATPR